MPRHRSRTGRSAAALLAVIAVLLTTIGVAAAADYTSPSKVTTTRPNTLSWSGQGASGGTVSNIDCRADATHGIEEGEPYLLWVFTTDGGSVAGTPVLTVNGNDHTPVGSGAIKFVTPYVTPTAATLTASVAFDAATTGAAPGS